MNHFLKNIVKCKLRLLKTALLTYLQVLDTRSSNLFYTKQLGIIGGIGTAGSSQTQKVEESMFFAGGD
jgi:hypothetical protein